MAQSLSSAKNLTGLEKIGFVDGCGGHGVKTIVYFDPSFLTTTWAKKTYIHLRVII